MAPSDRDNPMASTIEFVSETLLPTGSGSFRVRAYRELDTGKEPVAIVEGDVDGAEALPVRVHDECFTSEVLGSLKCDCADQLSFAMDYIKRHKLGAVIYLRQEGRGIGLANKIAAYALQEAGHDTVDANRMLGLPDDTRKYDTAAAILADMGVESIRLMTNNPRKVRKLEELGVRIEGRIPTLTCTNPHSQGYLEAKAQRMGHMLEMDALRSNSS